MVAVETDQQKFLDDCAPIQWGGGYGWADTAVLSPWAACPPYPDPISLSGVLDAGGTLYVAREDTGAILAFVLMAIGPDGPEILWVNSLTGTLADPSILEIGTQILSDLGQCWARIGSQESQSVAMAYPDHFRVDPDRIHCLG